MLDLVDPKPEALPLRIEVFSDIACPWCYVGERRLAAALAQRPGLKVARFWKPYQLQPEMPAEGQPWRTFAEEKFGSWERAQAMFQHLDNVAEGLDLDFRFDLMPKAPNTRDAHRLILHAGRYARMWSMAERLFRAYFTEGLDVTDRETLVRLASETGLDPESARALLMSDEGTATVEASQREAATLGVSGVPFYVFEGRYGLAGAQPVEVFTGVLDQIAQETAGART